ncbi:MAG TPA: radical SAM family heme chaperone HemW [Thermoanaerobaculia bacterium]|nr:radical SAM family heme chaperone HemW [Thermoanaerobaculia bacterium]
MSLGLYLHLPFCTTHCTYCPFAISTDLGLQDRYIDALLREVDARANGEAVDSIYLGGGTPSRTSIGNLERLFARLRASFDVGSSEGGRPVRQRGRTGRPPSTDAEISMEANPEDVTPESLDAWRALGVNRISIGVQSFHDAELAAISRVHDRARAMAAVRDAVASGMRANLDLILGLPEQTTDSFRETLDTAIALGAGHLSLYMLDLEEKTPLQVQVERGRVALPEEESVATLYVEAIEHLGRAGLHQYEISNFARAGEECRHNLRYWTRGEYHGFGLAAHSFLGSERFANTRDIRRYIELSPAARDFSEQLGENEARRETIFLGLRQTSGLHYEELARLCGQEGNEWIERGLRGGWLRRVDGRVAFTPAGFLQSNELIAQLF